MRELLSRLRIPLLFAGLAVLAAILLFSDQRALEAGGRDLSPWTGGLLELATPVQRVVTAPIDLAQDLWSDYVALFDVRDENQALRRRVAELEEETLQLREALIASGSLEELASLRGALQLPMVASEVVGEEISPWFRSVLLDRGRSHGLRAGMPVVTEHGLAGLLTATTPGAARAMLILDRQSAVDGMVQRSRTQGIVRGRGDGRLEYEFEGSADAVRPGDLVMTSGHGGVYPKGIRIGEVVAVDEEGGLLLRRATLEPSVPFGGVERVFTLLWRSPTLELLHADEGPVAGSGTRKQARATP